jgi:hypothetical protein
MNARPLRDPKHFANLRRAIDTARRFRRLLRGAKERRFSASEAKVKLLEGERTGVSRWGKVGEVLGLGARSGINPELSERLWAWTCSKPCGSIAGAGKNSESGECAPVGRNERFRT